MITMNTSWKQYIKYALAGLALVAVISMGYNWYKPGSVLTNHPTLVATKPAVASIATHTTEPISLKVYDKKALAKKVELSQEVQQSDNKQVAAVADIPATKTGVEVVTVVDTNTHEIINYAREKKAPFLELLSEKRLGVKYGYSTKNGVQTTIFGDWYFARVGNARVGVQVEAINSQLNGNDGGAMVLIDYRF